MKKRCTAVFVILLILLLSGCTQPTTKQDKFIGTWTSQEKTNPMDGSTYTDTVTFDPNGTYTTTSLGIGSIPGRWSLQNGKVRIDTIYPGTYQYSFSENNTVLTLISDSNGEKEILTKQ
jgi:hypothetical protein